MINAIKSFFAKPEEPVTPADNRPQYARNFELSPEARSLRSARSAATKAAKRAAERSAGK